jgi:hypothetical protein
VNLRARGAFEAIPAVSSVDTGVMKFYRTLLDSGEFEYARDHGDDRADYFDDELRIWVACDSLHAEIRDDGMWTPCTEHEAQHAAEAWPGMSFDVSRVLA